MGWYNTHVDKSRERYLRSKEFHTQTRAPSPDSSARKTSPHNFWLQKPTGIELVEEAAGALSCPSGKPMHLFRLTPSELQHQGGSLKSTSAIQGETEVPGIGVSRGHCPFAEPSAHTAGRLVSYLTLHRPG